MDTPTFELPLLRVAWNKDKRNVARLVLSDSGLTRRLTPAQLEHLSRIAGVGKP